MHARVGSCAGYFWGSLMAYELIWECRLARSGCFRAEAMGQVSDLGCERDESSFRESGPREPFFDAVSLNFLDGDLRCGRECGNYIVDVMMMCEVLTIASREPASVLKRFVCMREAYSFSRPVQEHVQRSVDLGVAGISGQGMFCWIADVQLFRGRGAAAGVAMHVGRFMGVSF